MKIIVFSDSHGQAGALEKIVKAQPDAARYIFLGDGAADIQHLRRRFPHLDFYSVKGNSDFLSGEPDTAEMEVCGKEILYTHGHLFRVKLGLEELFAYARRREFKAVLFGHTHIPYYDFKDGIHFLNPGAAVSGDACRFGIVDITETGIVCMTARIDR